MARIFIEGFEAGHTVQLWDSYNNMPTLATSVAGMSGTYSCFFNDADFLQKTLPARADYYIALKYRDNDNGNGWRIKWLNGTTVLGVLQTNRQAHQMSVYRGDSATLLATGGATFNAQQTYLLEIYYKPHATEGSFIVKLDGLEYINYSGNTGTTTDIDAIRIGTNYCGDFIIDDVVIDDSAWVGNTKIQALAPTGAGNSSAWTPSTGSNYDCVNEIIPVDTDYVSTNVVDNVDTYAMGNMVDSIGSVKCVQIQARVKTEGVPTPTHLQLACRSGGADHLSANKLLSSSFVAPWNLWETDPADSAVWTKARVDAIEVGFKATA